MAGAATARACAAQYFTMTLQANADRAGNSRHRDFRKPESVLIARQLTYAFPSMRVSRTEHGTVCYREGGHQEVRLDGERDHKPIETDELAVANGRPGSKVAPLTIVLSSSPGVK
ncbi:hypothetical protein [Bradyrhizobium vignae]|uniref:hypothetical protein n=1 Tax=Bradyrhizobium vignae TaxID=1549949 RepID=UPI0011AEA8F9|nr:hypothetical protein [Bradyrhizobium vignae]